MADNDQRMREIWDIDGENRYIESLLAFPKTGATVLKIGTGTGAFARYIATKVEKVYAVDVSDIMLEYVKQQAVKENLTNIVFSSTGFLSFQLPDASVDAMVSGLTLHHLPDTWKMVELERIAAALKTGGRLQLLDVAFDWQPGQSTGYFKRICHSVCLPKSNRHESACNAGIQYLAAAAGCHAAPCRIQHYQP